jgi:hypothetical protein
MLPKAIECSWVAMVITVVAWRAWTRIWFCES